MAKYLFPPNIENQHPTFMMLTSYKYNNKVPNEVLNSYLLPVPTELMDAIAAQYEIDYDDFGEKAIHRLKDLGGAVSKELGKATGIAVNKNTMPVFKEMEHRRFSFNWQLKAKTKRDADNMIALLEAIREDGKAEKYIDGESTFLRFPPVWKIKLSSGDKLIKFSKDGYILDRVSVSFNEGKWIQFHDGNPVSAFLNMSFIERDRPIRG